MTRSLFAIVASSLLFAGCADDAADGADTSASSSAATGASSGAGTGGDAPADCSGTPSEDETFSAAMDALRGGIASHGATGGAIAVIRDGVVDQIGVAGSKTAKSCDPITENTLFEFGFATPFVTAIAVLDAIEDGAFGLDTPLVDLLDITVERGDVDAIEVQHLLALTSMFAAPSDVLTVPITPDLESCGELAEVFPPSRGYVVDAPPGLMQDPLRVSSYELLGLALERKAGQRFEDVLRARVLAPLGAGGAFTRADIESGDYAISHYFPNPADEPLRVDCRTHDPSLGYFGSIRDASKIVAYIAGGPGEILEPANRARLTEPQAVSFSSDARATFGANVTPLVPGVEGDDVVWSSGFMTGFATTILIFPQRGLAVVALLNVGETFAWDVGDAIARLYDPTLPPGATAPFPLGPADLPSYTGTYVDPIGLGDSGPRTCRVTAVGDALEGELETADGVLSFVLEGNESADNFTLHFRDAPPDVHSPQIRFWRDDTGRVAAVQAAGMFGPPFYPVEEEDNGNAAP